MKLAQMVATTLSALSVCAGAHAYYADEQSTETLWKMSPTERIAAEKARKVRPHYLALLEKYMSDNVNIAPGATVFLGASTIEGFPCEEAFGAVTADGKRTVANRGIGGDDIENMLTRLDVCVRDLKPTKLLIQVGTNDIWWVRRDYKDGNLGVGYERLIKRVRELSPKTELVFTTILPINTWKDSEKDLGLYREWVARANDQLKDVCKKYDVKLYDMNAVLSNGTGRMVSRYSSDGVHLTLLGYLRWIDELVPAGPERMQVWKNLSKNWSEATPKTYALSGANKLRGEQELVLYKREGGTSVTTGTNMYGAEVTVVDDRVTSVARVGNMPIPEKGYVLSGNDKAAGWLLHYAPMGATVEVTDNTVTAEPDWSKESAVVVYEHARGELMKAMVAGKTDLERFVEPLEKTKNGNKQVGLKTLTELSKMNEK